MAVTIEELQAVIKLDDSALKRGLADAEKAMADFSKVRPLDGWDSSVNRFRDTLGRFTLDPLKQAFKTLGIESQASLNKTAQEAQHAFAVISSSGRASAADVANAFKAAEQATKEAAAGGAKALADQQARVESLKASIASMAAQLQLAGGIMLGTFGGAIAYSVKAASDLSEAVNKVQVVFGESAKSVQDFAQSSSTNLGLSSRAALDYAGSLGNMFTAMHLSTAAAAEFSEGILSLAADVASFNNIGVDDALNKLKSGLQGEAESLRSVGVLISDTAIKAKAMELGIKSASGELSEQQKVLLRYITILDQTKVQQGDFARTTTGMANSSRILAAQFDELVTKIGDRFSTAGNTAIGVGVQLLSVFNNLPAPILAAGAAVLTVEASLGAAALAVGSMVALLGGPLTLAFIGVAAWAGALAIGISQNWGAIVEATGGMNIGVTDALRSIAKGMGWVVDVISAATRAVITYFDVILNGARILGNSIINVFKVIAQSLSGIMTAIASGNVTEIAQAFTTTFASAFTVATAGVSSELTELANRTMNNVRATMDFLGGKTANAFGAAFDAGIKQAQSFDFAALRKKIEDELKKLTGAAGGGKAKKAGQDVAKEISDGFKDGLVGFEEAFSVIKGADTSKIASLFDPLKKAGREGLKELSDAFKAVTPVVNEFLRSQGIAANVTKEELEKLATSGNTALLGYTLSWATAKNAIEEAGKEMAGRLPVSLKDINQFLKDQGYEIQVSAEAWSTMTSASKDATVALGNLVKGQQDLKTSTVSTGEAIESVTARIMAHKTMVAEALAAYQRHEITLGEYINRLHGVAGAEKLAVESADNLGTHVESMAEKIDKALGDSHFLNFAREQLNIHSSIESAIRDIEQYGEMTHRTAARIEQDIADQSEAWTKSGVITREEVAKIIEAHKRAANQLPGVWESVFKDLDSGSRKGLNDVFAVIQDMPFALGESLRKSQSEIEKWVKFLDSSTKLIQHILGQQETGIKGIFDSIASLFKKTQQQAEFSAAGISNSAGLIIKNFNTSGSDGFGAVLNGLQETSGALSDLGESGAHSLGGLGASAEASGGKMSAAFGAASAALGAFMTGLSTANATGSKTFGAIAGGLQGAMQGFMVAGPWGALAGGVAGVLGGLFGGGKSAAVKEQERLQLQKLKDDVAKDANDIMSGALDNIKKALDLAPQLAEMEGVGKKQIAKVFLFMTRLANGFIEMSKSWNAANLTSVKAAAENIGPVFEVMANVPAAASALNKTPDVSDIQIDRGFSFLDRLVDRWSTRAEAWAGAASKRIKKVAEKITPAVNLVSPLTQAITDVNSLQEPDDAKLGIAGRWLDKIIDMYNGLADRYAKPLLKSIEYVGEKLGPVLDAEQGIVDLIKATIDFPVPQQSAANNVATGMRQFVDALVAGFADFKIEGLGMLLTIAEAIPAVATAVKVWVEASTSAKGFTANAVETWQAVGVDMQRAFDLITLMINGASAFVPKSEQFKNLMVAISDNLKAGLVAIGEGLQAAASAFGGVVNAIQGGAPPGSVFPGGDEGAPLGALSLTPSFAGGSLAPGSVSSGSANVEHHYHFGDFHVQTSDPEMHKAVIALMRLFGVGDGFDAAVQQNG